MTPIGSTPGSATPGRARSTVSFTIVTAIPAVVAAIAAARPALGSSRHPPRRGDEEESGQRLPAKRLAEGHHGAVERADCLDEGGQGVEE
jgi:hypothetical protein